MGVTYYLCKNCGREVSGPEDVCICQEITTLRAKLTQVEQDRDRLAAEVEKLYVGHAELFHDLKAENERLVEECKTLNEIYHRQLGDQMELYEIRREMHRIGERLIGEEIDEQDQIAVGGELIGLSRLCHFCGGTGEDGDPDGGTYACDSCGGKALVGQSPSERITDLQTQLTAAQEENKRLTEENADLLAALQIVKEQRQLWWGKAVHRGRELSAAQQSAKVEVEKWKSRNDRLWAIFNGMGFRLYTEDEGQTQINEYMEEIAQEQYRAGMERAAEIAGGFNLVDEEGKAITAVTDAICAESKRGKK